MTGDEQAEGAQTGKWLMIGRSLWVICTQKAGGMLEECGWWQWTYGVNSSGSVGSDSLRNSISSARILNYRATRSAVTLLHQTSALIVPFHFVLILLTEHPLVLERWVVPDEPGLGEVWRKISSLSLRVPEITSDIPHKWKRTIHFWWLSSCFLFLNWIRACAFFPVSI